MSIIADALKRLQTQTESGPSDSKVLPPHDHIPTHHKNLIRHPKTSSIKFLMVGVGITVVFGVLAFTTFWIGWQLDVQLATHTQAKIPDQDVVPTNVHRTEKPNPSDHNVDTMATVLPVSIPSPTTLMDEDQPSPEPGIISDPASNPQSPSQALTTTPSHLSMTSATSQVQTVIEQKISANQSEDIHTEKPSLEDKEQSTTSSDSSTEKPSSFIVLNKSSITTEPLEVPKPVVHKNNPPDHTKSVMASLQEEEVIQTESFPRTSTPSKDSTTTGVPAKVKLPQQGQNPTIPTTIPPQPTQIQSLRQAQKLIQTRDYKQAITLLSPLFHEPPTKWEPWFWMGTALLGQGKLDKADQFLLGGLARNDQIPQLWIQRALVAQQRGEYQLAIHELRQAEFLQPKLPHIHLNMGYAYEQLGNNQLANQYYGKFLQLSQGNPALFPIRKKILARVTKQNPPGEKPAHFSASSSQPLPSPH